MNSARFPILTHDLPAGPKLLLSPRPHLPLVSFTLCVPSGTAAEAAGQAGLANFAALLLSQGTGTRDAVRLAEEIDALGASLGIQCDHDDTCLYMSCLARDVERALEILADVASDSAYLDEEIERKRNDIRSALERRRDDPAEQVRNRFSELIYGEHPYRHPRLGYPGTIQGFSAGDVRSFHAAHHVPAGALLAVVGDVDPDAFARMARDRFARWQGGRAAERPLPEIPARRTRHLEVIQKDGLVQATLRVGGVAIRRDSPDHAAVTLVNYVLGGSGFGSRLMKNLREDRGLTYGAYSGFHTRKLAGHFMAGLQTQLDTAQEALDQLFLEIVRLREHGVTGEELDWARRYFTGSMPLSFQTNDQLATHIIEREVYGLEPEFWLVELEKMKELTLDEVNAAARRYLEPESFLAVALGDFRGRRLALSPLP